MNSSTFSSKSTVGEALNQAKQRLTAISSSASLDAQLLLAEVTGKTRTQIIAYPEHELTTEQITHYASFIARREQGEPIAYILGHRAWYDREFEVTPDVLIPRPETELLLEWALEIAQHTPVKTVVDVGTGSGALAVTFATLMPTAKVYAVDISPRALVVAQRNADRYNSPVTFLQGDLLQPLLERGIQPDLILANLPYIASDEVSQLEVSRYEPILALDGGGDGLDLIRKLLAQAKPASLLLEIGADQGAAMMALAQGQAVVELRQDYAGLDRMVYWRYA